MSHPNYNDYYYEDINDNDKMSLGEFLLTKETILDFANQWDPMVFHTDEELAKSNKLGIWKSNFIKPWNWRKK